MGDTEYLNSSEKNKEVLQKSINSYNTVKSVKSLNTQMDNMSVEELVELKEYCDKLIKSKEWA